MKMLKYYLFHITLKHNPSMLIREIFDMKKQSISM